jgi:hypothetical protein
MAVDYIRIYTQSCTQFSDAIALKRVESLAKFCVKILEILGCKTKHPILVKRKQITLTLEEEKGAKRCLETEL